MFDRHNSPDRSNIFFVLTHDLQTSFIETMSPLASTSSSMLMNQEQAQNQHGNLAEIYGNIDGSDSNQSDGSSHQDVVIDLALV